MDEERVVRGEKEMKSVLDTRVVGETLGLHSGGEEDSREDERVAIFFASLCSYNCCRVYVSNT